MTRADDTDRRHGQTTRTDDTGRRHGQTTRTDDTDRRHGQTTRADDTGRRHGQTTRTDDTSLRRYSADVSMASLLPGEQHSGRRKGRCRVSSIQSQLRSPPRGGTAVLGKTRRASQWERAGSLSGQGSGTPGGYGEGWEAPGSSGEAPGSSGEAPGSSGELRGGSGELRGGSGELRGGSGELRGGARGSGEGWEARERSAGDVGVPRRCNNSAAA